MMKPFMRRVVTVVGSLATVSALGVLAAAPASAAPEVEEICGRNVCIIVAHDGKRVRDITVYTPDGVRATLRAFVGNFRDSRNNTNRFLFPANRNFPNSQYACGGVSLRGVPEENVCIEL